MRTNEVVDKTGLSKDTLRYDEKIGLVSPNRDNYARDYTQSDLERLEHIQFLKKLNYSLQEIQQFVTLDDQFEDAQAIENMTLVEQNEILELLSNRIQLSEEKITELESNLKRLKLMKQRVESLSPKE